MRTGVDRGPAGALPLIGLCFVIVGVVGAIVADTVMTVVLFAVLTPLTLLATIYLGIHLLSLNQQPRSWAGYATIVVVALIPPVGTLAINIVAMVLAHDMTGRTFWVPLAALAVNGLSSVAFIALAGALGAVFRRRR
jgi:hypothetical protein